MTTREPANWPLAFLVGALYAMILAAAVFELRRNQRARQRKQQSAHALVRLRRR